MPNAQKNVSPFKNSSCQSASASVLDDEELLDANLPLLHQSDLHRKPPVAPESPNVFAATNENSSQQARSAAILLKNPETCQKAVLPSETTADKQNMTALTIPPALATTDGKRLAKEVVKYAHRKTLNEEQDKIGFDGEFTVPESRIAHIASTLGYSFQTVRTYFKNRKTRKLKDAKENDLVSHALEYSRDLGYTYSAEVLSEKVRDEAILDLLGVKESPNIDMKLFRAFNTKEGKQAVDNFQKAYAHTIVEAHFANPAHVG